MTHLTRHIALICALFCAAPVFAQQTPVISAPDSPGRVSGVVRDTMAGQSNGFLGSAPVPPMRRFDSDMAPVVVELFTSQGCSSCPPVDAMVGALAAQPDVLPLSFHVDYWDYLGWADSFAQPEFTQRQEDYARAAGERSVYTPQLILDGRDTALSMGPTQLMGLIDAHRAAPAMITVQRQKSDGAELLDIAPLSDLGGSADVVLVRYAPERDVTIATGENRGKSVRYVNVVLGVQVLARWDGSQPLRLTVRPDDVSTDRFPADTRHVILIQRSVGARGLPGAILGALRLD
ncbi:thioredoxin family protein [Paracoccus sp. (in: a-proteobacteria)]|uniref:DUF1223 domain-containing protein n=1 Tax=Paracoccus sp. TaxID=267 RepID=UPI0026DF8412|nr:DUF1223 domain-containing protein [Paracoccus sp. (in: a-proteobacteria)]MDO5648212.1 DUF1223 domain-containing protein [Paracoccus sp. (in: a-proteobacteria)]